MLWSQALVLLLMVASAGCSSGAGGPLYWDGAAPKSRALTAEQADLRQPAHGRAPVVLDPLCAKYRLFDSKKTRANCDSLISVFLTYASSLLAGKALSNSTSVNVINVVRTLVIEEVRAIAVGALTNLTNVFEDVFKDTPLAAPSKAGSRLVVESALLELAPLELNSSQFDEVVRRVAITLKEGLVVKIGALVEDDIWNKEPMNKAINLRIFNDLTFVRNTGSPARAAILAAARETSVNETDQLAVSVLKGLKDDCDAAIGAALEAAGTVTTAILNGTAGAGGAVSKAALSNAEAALSEAIGGLNGTITAALASPASALSAAVLARAAEELSTAGSDLVSAAGDAATGAILSGISNGGGGAVLQALANITSALSAALAKLLSTEISNAASALRAALSSLADSRAAAAVAWDGGLIIDRLNNGSSHLSTALLAHISGVAGSIITPATFAQRLTAAITNASGVVPSELSRSGSQIRSAVEAAAAPEAAAAVATALLAGGAITGALGEVNASACNAVAGAVAFSLEDPAAAVTQAADAAITADVLAALQSNGSTINTLVDAAAVEAAKAIGTLNATVQSAVQTELQLNRKQTKLCGELGAAFSVTQNSSVFLTGQSTFSFTPVSVAVSCGPTVDGYLVHGYCSLSGPLGATWDYILNGEEVDYTTGTVTCKAGPVSVFAGTNTNEDGYTIRAFALCCPFDQTTPSEPM